MPRSFFILYIHHSNIILCFRLTIGDMILITGDKSNKILVTLFLVMKKRQDSVKNGQLFRFEDFYQIQFVKNGLLDCK